MIVITNKYPKLCHAKPGEAVRLLDDEGTPAEELFLVCAHPQPGKRASRPISTGLYDDERPLFLVSLESGLARPMPHLSSRVSIVRDAMIIEGPLPKEEGQTAS